MNNNIKITWEQALDDYLEDDIKSAINENTDFKIFILVIDDSWWVYSTWHNQTILRETVSPGATYVPTTFKTYVLPLILELNRDNPRETLNRFFKLLVLK